MKAKEGFGVQKSLLGPLKTQRIEFLKKVYAYLHTYRYWYADTHPYAYANTAYEIVVGMLHHTIEMSNDYNGVICNITVL